ncbi:MAG: hypothetical protein BroJett014_07290 [Planctomycetota bacterium]|nr:MAG: hypothetical protein BroJett014_07290 [Planctomycetota bacterium]
MKPFMVVSLLALICLPLSATSIDTASEPRAAAGALSDRLRAKYRNNGNKFDPAWLDDGLASRDELAGSFCDASNYGFSIESTAPPVVLVVYRKRLSFQPHDFYVRVRLDTGEMTVERGTNPEGRAIFPWPPDPAVDAQRLRREWLSQNAALLLRIWWIGTSLCVSLSALWVWRAGRRSYGERSHAAVLALSALSCAWVVYAWIEFEFSQATIMWLIAYVLGAGFFCGGVSSLIANQARTRMELTLSIAMALLVVPPAVVLFTELAQLSGTFTHTMTLLPSTLLLTIGAQVMRHRSAGL